MAFRGHACAAVRTDEKRNLRQRALCHHRVRNDADIGAEADELNALQLRKTLEIVDQGRGAEAGLVKDRRVQNSAASICQPAVPSMQCGTGSFRPSCVDR